MALVERQIDAGVHGLVPVGTTGESATLSHEEHHRVVELCVRAARGRVPVIAGAGSNATAEAIDLARHAKADRRRRGADGDALLQPAQPGGALSPLCGGGRGGGSCRSLVYNVPSRTSVDISNDTLARLSQLPNIVGVKDATGDMTRPSFQRLGCGPDWVMLSGDDPTAWATSPTAATAASR